MFSVIAKSQTRELAVTIDDLPVADYDVKEDGFKLEITQKLMSSLNKYNVKAIGFVNSIKIEKDSMRINENLQLLRIWLDSGMQLGNHTYSHINLYQSTLPKYFEDVIKGEKYIKDILAERKISLKYFRHPYLFTGRTLSSSDSLSRFLTGRGYTIVPVTVDNDDYLFAVKYSNAYKNSDSVLMKKIGNDYVDYLISKIRYYELQSIKLFGKNIKQILLMHASLLNADYISKVFNKLSENNYKFISIEQALNDPLYKTPVTAKIKWGISWLDRWALSAGKDKTFFKDYRTATNLAQTCDK